MSGFINNYYYGKAGKADFTPENLPDSRSKLFFEMLRIHFSGLCAVNLFYLIFCIPALLWTLTFLPVLMAAEQDIQSVWGNLTIYLIGMVPCLTIAGAGAPGLMYICRNWARDQHAFLVSDFKDQVKANWKQGMVVGLVNGLSLLISYVAVMYYSQMAQGGLLWVIPEALVVMMLALWWMINMLIFPMMVTYDMNLRTLIRNSALIAAARLPWSILFLLGAFLVPVVIAVFVPYGYLVMILIYLVVGFALTGFIYSSYAVSCFDRFLNPKIEGAPTNLGLRDKSLDEDDGEDDEDAEKPGKV
jgi:uncharacterized membrane protein YesL